MNLKPSGLASSRRRLPAMSAAAVCGLILLAAGLAGCDSSPRTKSRPPRGDQQRSGGPALIADPQLCRERLNRAVDLLGPDRLGITVDRKMAVRTLNDWGLQCVASDSTPDLTSVYEKHASPETRARMADRSFSSRDCDHIRACFLFQRTLDFTVSGTASELERVVDLFYHVIRTIELVDESPGRLPLTPYEIVVFGTGTAEDRAWVFAELVRQMRLDAVIVRPAGATDAADAEDAADALSAAGPFLVGVVLDDEVYLFDCRLGLPVPAGSDDGRTLFVRAPATLAEAVADAEILERLNVDAQAPYPMQAADLHAPRVELIGNSSFWAPRMQSLQSALSGDQSAILFDPLADEGAAAGLVTRVAEAGAGRWTSGDLGVWSYPESRLRAFEALDRQSPQDLEAWLKAPYPIAAIAATGEPQYGSPQNHLIKSRMEHILGDFADATKQYTTLRGLERALVTAIDPRTRQPLTIPEPIRQAVQERIPDVYRQLHRRAADHAWFWLGLSQYQTGQFRGALLTLGSYIAVPDTRSRAAVARELRAICLAEDGQLDEAVQELRTLVSRHPDYPGRHGIELLMRRWSASGEQR